jgi:RNA polymerase sigma-70 factor (ECF subfamily)
MKSSSGHAQEDFKLIRAYNAGDEQAFTTLVRRYQRQVANVIYLTLAGRDEVDDLTQEVFIRVHRSLASFEFDASFFSWLYRITMNLCIDEIRRRKLRKMFSLDFLMEGGTEPEEKGRDLGSASDGVLEEEKRRIILDALQKISQEHREIIVLREYEDLAYNEIADLLGISLQAVKSRLFRARDELRELLKGYFRERI